MKKKKDWEAIQKRLRSIDYNSDINDYVDNENHEQVIFMSPDEWVEKRIVSTKEQANKIFEMLVKNNVLSKQDDKYKLNKDINSWSSD